MITELASLISTYGFPTVAVASALYILLRGEVHFRYPRTGKGNHQETSAKDPSRDAPSPSNSSNPGRPAHLDGKRARRTSGRGGNKSPA